MKLTSFQGRKNYPFKSKKGNVMQSFKKFNPYIWFFLPLNRYKKLQFLRYDVGENRDKFARAKVVDKVTLPLQRILAKTLLSYLLYFFSFLSARGPVTLQMGCVSRSANEFKIYIRLLLI